MPIEPITGKSGYEYVSSYNEIVARTIERCALVADAFDSREVAAAIRALKDDP